MNPIDATGNILNVKDFVAVNVGGGTVLTGLVDKIKEASVVMSKNNDMLPGTITIQIPITIVYNPQMPRIPNVYKLIKPPNLDNPA
jgi:hypothetical protein